MAGLASAASYVAPSGADASTAEDSRAPTEAVDPETGASTGEVTSYINGIRMCSEEFYGVGRVIGGMGFDFTSTDGVTQTSEFVGEESDHCSSVQLKNSQCFKTMKIYTKKFQVTARDSVSSIVKIAYTDSDGYTGSVGVSDGTESVFDTWSFGDKCATGYAVTIDEGLELFSIETSQVNRPVETVCYT